jgi:hypothetical protein
MVAPLIVGAGLGLAGAGLAGSLFGKKSVPTFNPTTANNLADQGSNQETGFINNYTSGVNKNQNTLRSDISTAEQTASDQSRTAANDYLSNYDPITSKIIQNRQDQLKRSTFGAIPEAVQAAREAGAAGGGLDRGVTQNALAQVPLQQAAQYNEGVANLQNTAMQGQLDARSKVFDSQNQLILSKLGIDSQTAEAILNSGNQALVNQLNTLIDSSRNAIGIKISADSAAQGSNIGNIQNENANRQAVYNSLMGAGGAMMGSGGSSPLSSVASNRTVISNGLNNASAGARA